MDKVNFNPFAEILVEDFLRQSGYIGESFNLLVADFLSQNTAVTGLEVTAQSVADMTVYVKPGRMYQAGQQGQLTANLDPALPITAAHPTYPRIDRICAQYKEVADTPETRNVMVDTVSRQVIPKTVMTRIAGSIYFMVVNGVAAPGPAAPTVPDGWVSLAQVTVRAATTSILQSDILDERPTLKSLATHTHTGGVDGAKIDYNSLLNTPVDYSHVWRSKQAYSVGDICYPKVGASYIYAECTVAGTTAAVVPTWPSVGSTVTDGTVTWKVCDIRQGTSVGRIPALIDVGGGVAGLPATDGSRLTARGKGHTRTATGGAQSLAGATETAVIGLSITVPRTGVYNIFASAIWNVPTGNCEVRMKIIRNGIDYGDSQNFFFTTGIAPFIRIMTIGQYTANDIITVKMMHTNGTALSVSQSGLYVIEIGGVL